MPVLSLCQTILETLTDPKQGAVDFSMLCQENSWKMKGRVLVSIVMILRKKEGKRRDAERKKEEQEGQEEEIERKKPLGFFFQFSS